MTIPTPTPRDLAEALERLPARSRNVYAWSRIQPGTWQRWIELPADTHKGESHRQAHNFRRAAQQYAQRRGWPRPVVRVSDCGRVVDAKFMVPPGGAA